MYMYFSKTVSKSCPMIERSTQDVSFPVFPENSHHFITLGTHPCGLFHTVMRYCRVWKLEKVRRWYRQVQREYSLRSFYDNRIATFRVWELLVCVQSAIYPPLRTNSYSTIQIRGVAYTVRVQSFQESEVLGIYRKVRYQLERERERKKDLQEQEEQIPYVPYVPNVGSG